MAGNKAEIDVFLELSCLFDDPVDVGNLISDSSAYSKSSLNIRKFSVQILLKPSLENFEHVRLIIFFAAKDGEALYNPHTRPGTDCGSDHELLIAKFRLKLKKVGKTTRQFRYELNQIPYDYIVEVMNRVKH